mgnify:CR=1 FL=1|jgi:hypothetical protein
MLENNKNNDTIQENVFTIKRGDKMTSLMKIENHVNEFAKAIAAALKVDVEIVDTELFRVAVVGKLAHMKEKKLFTSGVNYKRSFKSKKGRYIATCKLFY